MVDEIIRMLNGSSVDYEELVDILESGDIAAITELYYELKGE